MYEGEWSASRPSNTLLLGKDPQYPLGRRLGDLRAGLNTGYRKTPLPMPEIEPQSSL
jgi:hypothetical protein